MLKKILLSFGFIVALHVLAPSSAAASCGGPGEVPCYHWDWCAYTTPSIFGDVCWGGLVPDTVCGGCDCDRLNTWGLVCVPCGSAGAPTCQFGPVCDTDQRYTPFGLCYPCGQSGQAACVSGPACDVGNREIFGFCSYSGFSNEPTTNVATMPTLTQPATGPVRGIADLHTHQFSNLGFGGVVFWGAPYDARGINSALAWCDYTWDFSTKWAFDGVDGPIAPTLGYEVHGPKALQALSNPVSNGIPEGQTDVGGTGPFDGWPTWDTYTHQQMYYKWVERAFQGGIRLMVLHMVSNEALCSSGKIRSDFTCNDMDAVDREIQATKDLEAAIDRMDDGLRNGSGWYKIVYSPSQARDAIRSGKMAVVLGIEVDSLFSCKPDSDCSRDYLHQQVQKYYNLGIRHVFPIHQFDNAFGGAAIFRDELNAGNAVVTGSHFQVRDCSAQGYNYNVNASGLVDFLTWMLHGRPFPDQSYYDQFAADCNARGLTDTGRDLINELMDQKIIIDTDHMSRLMVDDVLQMARTTTTDRPNKYPLVSSHTSYMSQNTGKSEFSVTDAELDIFKEIGGMVTATNPKGDCSTSAQFRNNYTFAVGKMKKSDDDAFPGVGFSTDMNGFGGSTSPRFGQAACPGTPGTQLTYPFNGVMGGTFNRQVTGDRTFDFNNDGLAQYGLLPDFFADVKRTGTTDAELDPLLNSAETYIRLWESVDNSDKLPPPGITANVTGTKGSNGWYTSDVTVTWDVETAPDVTAVASHCDATTITTDTKGTTLTCTASNQGTGESSSASVTIKRDATPPAWTATRTTPANANGWTNGNVTVVFTAQDGISGIGGGASFTAQFTKEGANQSADYTFFDQAGNRAVAHFGGVNIDKTRPRILFRFANLPENATPAQIQAEQAKWHNGPVTLIVDARDDLSGIASVSPAQLVFATEGTNLIGLATATDLAGNSVTDDSDPVKIDLTPPAMQLVSRSPAANAFGWNNGPVTVTWSCSDSLSGVQAATVSRVMASEGDAQSAQQQCLDVAGNATSATQGGIRIDVTPPTLTFNAQQPPANANGWNRTDVAVPFAPDDALSGVATTSLPSPLTFTAEGAAVNGSVTVTDKAGNSAQFTSPSLKIDKTPPAISFVSRLPAANAHGWNNTDITVNWHCDDGLSGVVVNNPSATLFMEGANQRLTGRCTDLADNMTADTRGGLSLDKTAPVVTSSAAPAPNGAGWNNSDVTVSFAASDALSGIDGSPSAQMIFSSDGANLSTAQTFTDLAGNRTTRTQGGINLDKTPPVVECVAGPSMLWPPNNQMVPVAVALTFTDALSGTQSFAMTEASSNEAGTGDISGFRLAQPLLAGALRAQRNGSGGGRIYTLGYRGVDLAGNAASCSTPVTVPHDMSDSKKQ